MTLKNNRFKPMNKKIWILLVLLMGAGAFIWKEVGSLTQVKTKSQLEKVGDECAGIADNAVANMVAVVEFQKLEIQGRKIHVMRLCMADNGFQENPSWIEYAKPIAQKRAVQNGWSLDEAIENLKRSDMMVFEQGRHPPYWRHVP
jgi:hypothetical protein